MDEIDSSEIIGEYILTPEELSINIVELDYGTTYDYIVIALAEIEENNSPGTVHSFTTEPKPEIFNEPVKVNIDQVYASKAMISWEKPSYNISGQILHIGDVDLKPIILDVDITSYNISQLKPFQGELKINHCESWKIFRFFNFVP